MSGSIVGGSCRRAVALTAAICVLAAVWAAAPAVATAVEPAEDGQQCFLDVDATHAYYEAIQGLCEAGVIDGYPVQEGTVFRPGNSILRAQFAKMILGSLRIPVTEEAWTEADAPFTDLEVDRLDTLYPNDYVGAAYHLGVTYGKTATTYAPYVDITRAQVISMVVRAAQRFKADALEAPPAGWRGVLGPYYSNPFHGENARIAEYSGLLEGLVGFGAGWDIEARASRAEAAQIMWNLYRAEGGRFGSLLLFEDFSDPDSGWRIATGTSSEAGYERGRYLIQVRARDFFRLERAPSGPYADITIAVDATPAEGAGRSEYGLVFRLRDEANFYQLTVQSDGAASLWRRDKAAWVPMSTAVTLPPAGAGGTRRLVASMEGSVITCWVDDTKVGWFNDTTFADGYVGVFAGTIDADSTTARFDDFTVWSIDPPGGL